MPLHFISGTPASRVLLIYIIVISAVAIIITIADKLSAMAHRRRVPEATLILLSLLGGSAAMYFTMLIIRHKTRHLKFMAGIPLIIVIQAIVLVLCSKYFL